MNNPSANQKKSTLRDTEPLVRYSDISECDSRARPWVRQVARALTFFYLVQTIGVLVPAYAQVTPNAAAPAGQRPIMDAANNGTPIVNIAPPSAAGVSRNQYNQFNVDPKGLILNNSRGNTQTQIGGWIAGNPQLGATSARIILNEVVSGNASTLRGTIEVAGQKAGIVIANPNGVTCDGCGFLNTDRASLVAGTPQFGANGSLNGFNVGNGQVNIGAQGLNAANVEQLDLIARGIVIEGEVWTKNLNVIAGNNQVLYGTLQSIAQNGNGSGPAFAIDIKDLGGMYANQIYMVATEQGLGVNSTGRIAALQGNLTLSTNGDLTIKDAYAKQNLQLASVGNATLKGQTAAGDGAVRINTTGALTHQGTIDAQSGIDINAASLSNTGVIAQHGTADTTLTISGDINNSGTVASGGRLAVSATNIVDTNGKFFAGGDLSINAQSAALTGSELVSDQHIAVVASAGDVVTNNAKVSAGSSIVVTARDQIKNDAGTWQANGDIKVKGNSISNVAGSILANGEVAVETTSSSGIGAFNNSTGTIIGNRKLSVVSDQLINTGGTIASGASLSLDTRASAIENAGGQIVATSDLTINTGKVTNTQGAIASLQGSVEVDTNANELVNNDGKIQALENTTIRAAATNNRSGVISGNDVSLNTTTLDNTSGQIVAGGKLNAKTAAITNNAGLLQAVGDIDVDTQGNSLQNRGSGTVGGIIAGGSLKLQSGELDNRSGNIASNGNQTVLLSGDLDNSADDNQRTGGQLLSNGGSTINAAGVKNINGQIASLSDISITATNKIDNQTGSIASNGDVRLQAQQIDNSAMNGAAGTIDGKELTLFGDVVVNAGGMIRSTADTTLTTASFDNTSGVLSSSKDLALDATAFSNAQGKIVGGKAVVVNTNSQNLSGTISSVENLTLNVNGNYTNSGTVSAEKELTVNATNINNSGKMNAGEKLIANTGDLTNSGEISAPVTTLNVTGTLTNTATGLIDGSTTVINANVANNTGRIYGDLLKIQADTLNNSGAGVVAARENLVIGARNINNTNGGLIYSLGDIAVAGSFDNNLNANGLVEKLVNASAKIEAKQDIKLAVKDLINRNDELVTRTETKSIDVSKTYLQPQGSTDKYDISILGWNPLYHNFGAYVLPSTTYPFSRYGSTTIRQAYESVCGSGEDAGCTTTQPYTVSDPIWDVMGIARPQSSDLDPRVPNLSAEDAGMYGIGIYRQWQTYQGRVYAQMAALDNAITAFNTDLDNRSFQGWLQYEINSENTTETVVDSTKPAQILAGRAVSIAASGSVLNDNSNIVAGGAINVVGASVENRGAEGTKTVTEVGFLRQRYVYTSGRIMHWYDIGPTTGAPIVTSTSLQAFVYKANAADPASVRDLTSTATAPNANLANAGEAVSNQNVSASGKAINTSLSASAKAQLNGQTLDRQWTLPTNSLFSINTRPNANYLVETDPRFTNQKNFLSSDYYLNLVARDPSQQLKRYGDGFVEQQMVNDQILALTGRRYLSGYASTETEYKDLMDAGIAFAQKYQISPGVALSAEQMALLTTDVVVMTTKSITLPDGTTQDVLVPQVYLRRPQAGDLLPTGGLIAGSDVYIKSTSDIINSGQISTTGSTTLLADGDLTNRGGRIVGQDIFLRAGNDLKNLSGTVQGVGSSNQVVLSAGRDVILETRTISGATIASATTTSTTRTNADRIATVQGGTISIEAGRDLIGKGSSAVADQDLLVTAGRDIKVSAVEESYLIDRKTSNRVTKGRTGYLKDETVSNQVATFGAGNNVALVSGSAGSGNVELKGVDIAAGNSVAIQGTNVSIETVKNSQLIDNQFVGKNSYRREMTANETIVGGNILANKDVIIAANGDTNGSGGRLATGDLKLAGAAIQAKDGQLSLVANNNIEINAVTTNHSTANEYYKKTKGMFSSKTKTTASLTDTQKVEGSILGGDTVLIQAGNQISKTGDISVIASSIIAKNDIEVSAGRNLMIAAGAQDSGTQTLSDKRSSGIASSSKNYRYTETENTEAIASNISGNNISLSAGQDANLIGSHVNSVGDTTILAGRDVQILAATNAYATSQVAEVKKSGFGGSFREGLNYGTSKGRQTLDQSGTTSTGASVAGNNVQIIATRDVGVNGSAVLADQNVSIFAGKNINIDVSQETESTVSTSKNSNNGIGLTPSFVTGASRIYSQTSDKQNGQADSLSSITSLLSANSGNLTMIAGNPNIQNATVTTRGADLLAGKAITIEADQVDLLASKNTTATSNFSESKSFTIGSRPTGMIGGLVYEITENLLNAAEGTGNSRLDGALALKAGYDTYKLIEKSQQLAKGFDNAAQAAANADMSGSAFGISLSVGSSKSSSSSSTESQNITGTNLQAEEISIKARQTDIQMEAAKLQATNIKIDAARDVILVAGSNESSVQSKNSSSSASVGVTVGGGQQNGISFQIGMQTGNGRSNGSETSYDNTLITATEKLDIKSGQDTTLRGAQLAGKDVTVNAGRDLTIETLQDKSVYNSEQKSGGFGISLCIPPICYGASSVSVNVSNQSIKHNYQSAQGQSGIVAGDGGFDITVGNHTDLIAAAITSTAQAKDNHLITESIASKDLVNVQDTTAKSSSMSASISFGPGSASVLGQAASNGAANLIGSLGQAGMPKDEHVVTKTESVISPTQVNITSSSVEVIEGSQETISLLTSRDPATVNQALTNSLTLQQAIELEKELKVNQQNQQAAQLVGKVLTSAIGDYSLSKVNGYDAAIEKAKIDKEGFQEKLTSESDPAARAELVAKISQMDSSIALNQSQAELWADGGAAKIALHGLAGYLEGRVSGTSAGAAAFAAVSNEALSAVVNNAISSALGDTYKINPGDTPEDIQRKTAEYEATKKAFGEAASTLIGAVAGAVVGGKDGSIIGAQVALTAEQNNRQLHERELAKIHRLASSFARSEDIGSDQEAEARLTRQALKMADRDWNMSLPGNDPAALAFLLANSSTFNVGATTYKEFQATNLDEFRNGALFAGSLDKYGDQYAAASIQRAPTPKLLDKLSEGYQTTVGVALGATQIVKDTVVGIVNWSALSDGLQRNDPAAQAQIEAIAKSAAQAMNAPVETVRKYVDEQIDTAAMYRAQGRIADAAEIEAVLGFQIASTINGVSGVAVSAAKGGVKLVGNVSTKVETGATKAAGSVSAVDVSNPIAKQALDNILTNDPAVSTPGGYINGTKIGESGAVISLGNLNPLQQSIARDIAANGDLAGTKTEILFTSVSADGGYVSYPAKVGANQGLDHVLKAPNGDIVIVVDAKQINASGGIQMGSSNAGNQLGMDSIMSAVNRLPADSAAKALILDAIDNGNLKTAVVGVDKKTGNLVISPVKITPKSS